MSIIIPIFNQKDLVCQCVESVLDAKVDCKFRLMLINDGSTDPDIERLLESFEADERVCVVRNETNQGFTKTANLGIASVLRDSHPLLLNSDTIVYDHWLDAMGLCINSASRVATVTPMTNQRGSHISCYPFSKWADLDFPELCDADLARLAYTNCRDSNAIVHTGVGFCLLMNREAIRDVGQFDDGHFPRGYGEESDFCYRARYLGWKHLVCGGTFVTHLHGQSFGAEKEILRNNMLSVFRELHPMQPETDRMFRKNNPVNAIRRSVDFARLGALMEGRSEIALKSATLPPTDEEYNVCIVADGPEFSISVNGSDVGLPNIGTYTIPLDLGILLNDLNLIGVRSIIFMDCFEIADICERAAHLFQIDCAIEYIRGSPVLTW